MKTYDVVICGGGLAGLTLARHLGIDMPQLSVAVIDRQERPLPEAGFKVGESSVEVGAWYFSKKLQLQAYLDEKHLRKNGLRFFPGDAHKPIEERWEVGCPTYGFLPSFQLDRGLLEQDLREFNAQDGIDLFEGYTVQDITINSEDMHSVSLRHVTSGQKQELQGRWVVDAMGRRLYLQNKFGFHCKNGHEASSAWFRVKGRVDIGDFATSEEWRSRDPENIRYYSTNHMMGKGYWVWLIPLSTGYTSVGIVTDETIHPLSTYNSYEKALAWLKEYEPVVLPFLPDEEPLDFKALKRFSYGSTQVYSADRWSCVGEAGAFLDPFYSPGSDFITLSNSITIEMIRLEKEGQLTEEKVEHFNRFYLSIFESATNVYRNSYPIFGTAHVMTAKLHWDNLIYWTCYAPLIMHGMYKQPEILLQEESFKKYLDLQVTMQQFFRDWATQTTTTYPARYVAHPPRNSNLFDFHIALAAQPAFEDALTKLKRDLSYVEDIARMIFLRARREFSESNLLDTFEAVQVDPYKITLQGNEMFGGETRNLNMAELELRYYFNEIDHRQYGMTRRLTQLAEQTR